ncbi:MAG TPA: TOBE domain-containing protein, partial [Gaiellales bacterium]|nr:TOBE domain-containing protein [Gaiellales bacterium]
NEGRIEQMARPEVLYRNPATLFAARFVGAGAFVPAVVTGRAGERVHAQIANRPIRAVDAGIGGASTIQVLLRPEDLQIVEAGVGTLQGPVQTCAFFGSYYELTLDTEVGLVRARNIAPAEPGSVVGLTWSLEAGIAYPTGTDTRSPGGAPEQHG